ncbi:hypothetical protein FBU30_005230 [Linnemannia zychae]|nr:hypothetical protein FBU30_005230 [Linnemannia zychae]
MEEHDEQTSLVRSNTTANHPSLSSNSTNNTNHHSNNGYNATGNSSHFRPNQSHTQSHTSSGRAQFTERDPKTLFDHVQRNLTPFQIWAIKMMNSGENSDVVNWVQNARVARTFLMMINVFLALFAIVLACVEVAELVSREPILEYLLPESELTFIVAGLMFVGGLYGIAVAYNLLVEEKGPSMDRESNGENQSGNGSGGNRGDPGPRTPISPLNNSGASLALQQQPHNNRPSKMTKELDAAWTQAFRHSKKLISQFERLNECCGYNHIKDRAYPLDVPEKEEGCRYDKAYGFQLVLVLLVSTLSMVGLVKLKVGKQPGRRQEEEASAETSETAPATNTHQQRERPLLGDAPRNENTPLLISLGTDQPRVTQNEPVVLPSLI